MSNSRSFSDALKAELERRRGKNPRYSARAFAKFLNTDFSTFSKILHGKRAIGRRTIEKIGKQLNFADAEIKRFVADANQPSSSGSGYAPLGNDAFNVIADWYHLAILELMVTPDFSPDPRWIAARLGVPLKTTKAAIQRLQRAGLLSIDTEGTWHDLSGGRSSILPSTDTTAALRRHQRQTLQRAREVVDKVPWEERDQTSMTMAIDKARLVEAKELITRFRRELAHFLCRSGAPRTDVYNLSISLYPLTARDKETTR